MPQTDFLRVAPGIYRIAGFTVMKVAKNCWRITDKDCGNDFCNLSDAAYWCRNGGEQFDRGETAPFEPKGAA